MSKSLRDKHCIGCWFWRETFGRRGSLYGPNLLPRHYCTHHLKPLDPECDAAKSRVREELARWKAEDEGKLT